MSMRPYMYFGFYFEISEQVPDSITKYSCSSFPKHRVDQSDKFCSKCGAPVVSEEFPRKDRYLNEFEIAERAGISEETLLGTGEIKNKEHRRYFGINVVLDGVRHDQLNEEAFTHVDDDTYVQDGESAFKNKEFDNIVYALSKTFGDKFKLRYGIFTYVI